jgi:hypothetical protein
LLIPRRISAFQFQFLRQRANRLIDNLQPLPNRRRPLGHGRIKSIHHRREFHRQFPSSAPATHSELPEVSSPESSPASRKIHRLLPLPRRRRLARGNLLQLILPPRHRPAQLLGRLGNLLIDPRESRP